MIIHSDSRVFSLVAAIDFAFHCGRISVRASFRIFCWDLVCDFGFWVFGSFFLPNWGLELGYGASLSQSPFKLGSCD